VPGVTIPAFLLKTKEIEEKILLAPIHVYV
jgi:hypothetical protein